MSGAGTGDRRLAYWAGAAALAVAAPLGARALIDSAVDGALVPALERATGESVEVDGVEVSLFGAIAVRGLDLGHFITAERVEGRVALGSLLAGRLSADEIEIERPRIDLRQGGRRLRRLVAHLHARRGQLHGPAPATTSALRWPHLRVSGGELRIRTERGEIAVRGLRARPIGDGLRLISDAVELDGAVRGHPIELAFARAAADVDTAGGRLLRAVALGGRGRLGEIPVEDASVIGGDGGVRARARISGGQIAARQRGEVTTATLSAIPAGALAPLAGDLELSGGTISGSVSLRGQRASADLRLDGVAGQLGWLAPEPVDLSSRIEAELSLAGGDSPRIGAPEGSEGASSRPGFAGSRRPLMIDIERLEIRRGALVAHLSGVITAPGDLGRSAGQLRISVADAPCAAILEALPPQLSRALRGMQLDGRIGARIGARFDLSRPATEALELAVDLDPERCQVRGEAPRFVAGLAASDPVALDALPAHVPGAFLAAEDSRFYQHRGFDRRQIELSLAQNLQHSELLRGGSTITQQLAKNLFLDNRRTIARKLQEAVLAWRLEATRDKSEILARYLGVIQLGIEVRGLEPAARHWFAKPAARLTPREAAFLACLTRAPATLERSIRANAGLDPELARRVDNLLASLRFSGAISMATYREALSQDLVLAPLAVAAR